MSNNVVLTAAKTSSSALIRRNRSESRPFAGKLKSEVGTWVTWLVMTSDSTCSVKDDAEQNILHINSSLKKEATLLIKNR